VPTIAGSAKQSSGILEIGQVMRIPEFGQLLDGIGFRQFGFFHRFFWPRSR
jgi:hypothetical protein